MNSCLHACISWPRRFVVPTRKLFEFSCSDTVFSLSSGQGKCGVAVVRVSGPKASDALLQLGRFKSLPKPRVATVRKLFNPQTGGRIDHGLTIWFPGPNSFTGEDCVEFHVHGGTAVVLEVLNSLASVPSLKHAQPGDFTKRALLNGKLDLTEVEGLADLIHAETEAQRKQALRQMEGDLSKLYKGWSERLLQCVAHVEANIDFGEDENIEEGLVSKGKAKKMIKLVDHRSVCEQVEELLKEIQHHLKDGRRGERLRSGIQVAIVGAPNAGKSSLLNILCQRPVAIVSPYAGTTRDIVESSLDIFGYPVVLSDTAGLRQAINPVETEGIKRALNRAEIADLNILIVDSSLYKEKINSTSFFTHSELLKQVFNTTSKKRISETLTPNSTLIVMNKIDLLCSEVKTLKNSSSLCWLSCTTRDGVDDFLQVLKNQLKELGGDPLTDSPHLTQTRHRHHIEQCKECLVRFLNCSLEEGDLVIAAEELRLALRQIGRITGQVGIEEVLDVIFKDFCIGK